MFTILLIVLSVVFLGYSIFLCRNLIRASSMRIQRRAAHIMLSLIIIFFLGDIIYLAFSFDFLFSNFLVSILFFFSAFFVMLVLQVSLSLIRGLILKSRELKKFNDTLLKEVMTLSSSKKRLERVKKIVERKNKELEDTLEDLKKKKK
ncbi:hypothetical protein KY341_00880 [Candidatus Woesearchaeota archaeon]|nr:hypothetical protein [Candidatus Woesearchaeota archaeon]